MKSKEKNLAAFLGCVVFIFAGLIGHFTIPGLISSVIICGILYLRTVHSAAVAEREVSEDLGVLFGWLVTAQLMIHVGAEVITGVLLPNLTSLPAFFLSRVQNVLFFMESVHFAVIIAVVVLTLVRIFVVIGTASPYVSLWMRYLYLTAMMSLFLILTDCSGLIGTMLLVMMVSAGCSVLSVRCTGKLVKSANRMYLVNILLILLFLILSEPLTVEIQFTNINDRLMDVIFGVPSLILAAAGTAALTVCAVVWRKEDSYTGRLDPCSFLWGGAFYLTLWFMHRFPFGWQAILLVIFLFLANFGLSHHTPNKRYNKDFLRMNQNAQKSSMIYAMSWPLVLAAATVGLNLISIAAASFRPWRCWCSDCLSSASFAMRAKKVQFGQKPSSAPTRRC